MKGGISEVAVEAAEASFRTLGLVGKMGGLEAVVLGLLTVEVVLIGGDTCRRDSGFAVPELDSP